MKAPDLAALSDAKLLRCRFSELPIRLEGTPVAWRAQRVFDELQARGIDCIPSIWLSEEWFNPDGVVGFAIPFYLAHPRLIRLERHMMLEAEGAVETDCLRILRHETGHAIDEAFQLFRTPRYRHLFGSPRRPYPTSYAVEANSREFVTNLNAWYAQAHPVEDFAETFAVWLGSRRWRLRYRSWPALTKLEQVQAWMSSFADRPPLVTERTPVDTLQSNQRTLGEHYRQKRAFYGIASTTEYDRALQRLFPAAERGSKRRRYGSAASLLRAVRVRVGKEAGGALGVPAYIVDQVMRQLARRARALDLRVTRPAEETVAALVKLVTRATIGVLKDRQRFPL